MRTLSFTITGQQIVGSTITDLVGNTKNYVEASFTFDSLWDNITLKVAVFTANSKQYHVILDANSKAIVPEICMSGDSFSVGIIGAAGETRLTTDTATIRVEESVRTRPPYDLITMYDGILETIEDLQDEDTALDAKIDLKQPITLATPLTIDGTEETTVEGALSALNNRETIFDSSLSDSSENAVQNKVVKAALDDKQPKMLDSPITIGETTYYMVETVLAALLANDVTVDQILDATSTNPIANKPVTEALADKQPKTLSSAITVGGVSKTTVESALSAINDRTTDIDTYLSPSSTNPVQNKVIDTALGAKQPKTLDAAITVNGTQYTTVEAALAAINTLLANHIAAQVATATGVHDFRKDPNSSDLQYYDEVSEAWITISGGGGGGGTITVDAALSLSSTNPAQNKVITAAIYERLTATGTIPTASSTHEGNFLLYTGQTGSGYNHGYLYECLAQGTSPETYAWEPVNQITVDSALDSTSENPVQNKVIKNAFDTHNGKSVLSAAGAHDLRFYNSKLQGYNASTSTWDDIETGSDIGLSIVNGKICQTYTTT